MKTFFLFIILFVVSMPCLGANEVKLAYEVGNDLYFRIFDSTGQVWNTSLGPAAFQAWDNAQVANYDIALVGTGGSFYLGVYPPMSDGTYTVTAYLRATGVPLTTDGVISSGFMTWESNAEIDFGALIDLIDSIIDSIANFTMPSTQAGKAVR